MSTLISDPFPILVSDQWDWNELVEFTTQPLPQRQDVAVNLKAVIREQLSKIDQVEQIYTAYRNNVFYVWVVIDHFDSHSRESIYEEEKIIIEKFDAFDFDFYIVAREGQAAGELISGDVELTYDRSSASATQGTASLQS